VAYILSLDQGTSSSRALLFDAQARVVSLAQREFKQIYPQPGWVEHDPEEIWSTQLATAHEAIAQAGIRPEDVKAVGITNQRETSVIWDRQTGQPIANALVWQDRRTSELCKAWKAEFGELITNRTGLVVDAYFSGSKIAWLLDQIPGARAKAENGQLAFGTVDSWLIWKLTEGRCHVTDSSNASRTMLFNIEKGEWDPDLLQALAIPRSLLPEVVPSQGRFAETRLLGGSIPLAGIAGDQQSALFGQFCHQPGFSKTTYGTGCFMLLNTGQERRHSRNQLLSTVGWSREGRTDFALEGSVFIGGAAVGWLRDGLGIISSSSEVEPLARSVESSQGVVFVPAFNGLGTPYWDQDARGTIVGLTRGSTRAHIARATLEAIAFQVADLMEAMQKDSGIALEALRVDGGAAQNDLLMQIQADLLQAPVVRPRNLETTALGAALLAGLGVGLYPDLDSVQECDEVERTFEPQVSAEQAAERRAQWRRAVQRSLEWVEA
jgi:glycerol kinase